MKTFFEIRNEVLLDIKSETELSAKEVKYTLAEIEEMAAKAYAKQWIYETFNQLKNEIVKRIEEQ